MVAYEPGNSWWRAFRAHLATLRSARFRLATMWIPSVSHFSSYAGRIRYSMSADAAVMLQMRRYRRLILDEIVPRGEARYGPLGPGWVDRHLEEVFERLVPELSPG